MSREEVYLMRYCTRHPVYNCIRLTIPIADIYQANRVLDFLIVAPYGARHRVLESISESGIPQTQDLLLHASCQGDMWQSVGLS